MENVLHIREALLAEDTLIAEHFYQLWRDNDVSANFIESNWRKITLEFIDRARQELSYQAFVAELDGRVVGSVGCQLFAGLYPHILTAEYRKYGYIWGVYVEPEYRRKGIAKQLTNKALEYLKSKNCTRAILHASLSGKPVYSALSFLHTNEMGLNLNITE
ncbi:GNAT family N-acetyltransferase [Phormidium sp. LEGE 05292]|uniref:GNAT family N-acetyltransferase n=1 Tax=[Phormidium] sp. LEGE 05292 TaxID=767427 RepID=UPI00187DE22A|nr:GNAT family N-acetyltransferase [Phormidium sp. LEGE 05292]MBE9227518.1 GNAT family N-acetyltransferase [Phormidium sp. LEGE 05292]